MAQSCQSSVGYCMCAHHSTWVHLPVVPGFAGRTADKDKFSGIRATAVDSTGGAAAKGMTGSTGSEGETTWSSIESGPS